MRSWRFRSCYGGGLVPHCNLFFAAHDGAAVVMHKKPKRVAQTCQSPEIHTYQLGTCCAYSGF